MVTRCPWAAGDPLLTAYHDTEWGTPLHDDRGLFELLVLEGAQAGLSWITVLRKRANYRAAFAGFDPDAVARFDGARRRRLLRDPGLVRNRLKIESAVANARTLLEARDAFGSFDAYVWRFVGGEPIRRVRRRPADVPAETAESRALSKDMKARGFRFVGPTICYAFMQAAGLADDHLVTCFRHGAGTEPRGRPRGTAGGPM
ncbi:MAG TPA: DNA-3-methyladenine glycosylase I [bacterium]|nr:DNA-3-methyladenine glycosylase I [bacterium]